MYICTINLNEKKNAKYVLYVFAEWTIKNIRLKWDLISVEEIYYLQKYII